MIQNNKPRLRRYCGWIWMCGMRGIYGQFVGYLGHGYTPKEAWDEWKAQL